MMEKIQINPRKRVGQVLFLVEGEKTEFQYLKAIFERILGYEYHQVKGKGEIKLKHPFNNHSSVLVLNTGASYIASIDQTDTQTNEDNFFKRLHERLSGTGFRLNAARIYYIFDRDPASNVRAEKIREYFTRFSNSSDNGENRAGLLLLSYPSIEAHLISHFLPLEGIYSATGRELKNKLGALRQSEDCKLSRICKKSLVNATLKFLDFFNREMGYQFILDEKNHGAELFEHQEEYYLQNKKFKILSQLVQALLDLEIIKLIDR